MSMETMIDDGYMIYIGVVLPNICFLKSVVIKLDSLMTTIQKGNLFRYQRILLSKGWLIYQSIYQKVHLVTKGW